MEVCSEQWTNPSLTKVMAYREFWGSESLSNRWYENNKERVVRNQRAYSPWNKEHICSYRQKHGKDNREQFNKHWRGYYAQNKERIKQRLWDKKQPTNRPVYHAFWGLRSRVREIGNESSSQHYTMWNTNFWDKLYNSNLWETLKKDEKPRIKTITRFVQLQLQSILPSGSMLSFN